MYQLLHITVVMHRGDVVVASTHRGHGVMMLMMISATTAGVGIVKRIGRRRVVASITRRYIMILSLLVIPISARSANMFLRQLGNENLIFTYRAIIDHSFCTYRTSERQGSRYSHWSINRRYRHLLRWRKILW